jgi:hypothetical protein
MATPPTFTTGAVLTGAQMNQIGLWKITPTSVAGSGVSLSGSNIVFTSAATINVNGVFSADYDFYKVVGFLTPTSGTVTPNFKYRTAGTDNSSALYNFLARTISSLNGTTSDTFNRTQTIGTLMNGTTVNVPFVWEIQLPFDSSQNTFSQINGTGATGNAHSGSQSFSGNASFDGFSIIASTASYTGKLSVYGYRD